MRSYDVVVLGGGFAGCMAARDLRHAGRTVCLVEARDRLGGRTSYEPFPGLDQRVEIGGTWVCPGYQEHVTRELDRYGIGYVQSPVPQSFRWRTGGEVRSGLPVPADELAGLERILVATANAARRIKFGQSMADDSLRDLDVSVEQFAGRFDLGPAARDLVYGWTGLNSGSDPAEYSVLTFLEWLAGWDSSVFMSYAALTNKIAGGTCMLIDAMITDADAELALASVVSRVAQSEDRVLVTTLDGQELEAANAIVTVPLNVLGDLEFDPPLRVDKQAAVDAGHVGHSVKLWVLVQDAPQGLAACGWGGGLAWLATEYQTPDGQLMVGFGTDPARLDHTVPSAQRAVEEFCPDARVLAVHGHDWVHDPFAKGTWTAYRAGQAGLAAALREPEGRVAFATADAARRWIGFIEGGLEMGAEAAARLIDP